MHEGPDEKQKAAERSSECVSELYGRYMSTGYGAVVGCSPKEYEFQTRYFAKNHGRHLPEAKDSVILDVACGVGHFLYYAQKSGYTNCTGIDISQKCLEVCKRNGLPAEIADAFVYLRDGKDSFDAIVSNEFFEHLKKDQTLELAELCFQALKEGGVLIIKVPNAVCPIVGCRGRYSDITHEMGYTDHRLRTLLSAAGFRDAEIFGPDIYVTRNPLAGLTARAMFRLVTLGFRFLYLLYGVRYRHVMTKNIIGVARKPPPT